MSQSPEPSATLRAQHAEATRLAVLAAGRSLFGKKGFAQTSVDEIAATARVTKGAVYHHYASKKALFRAVYIEVEAETQARAMAAADPRELAIDQLVAMMNAYLDATLDEEIRRITLVDAPSLGLEPDESAGAQATYEGIRSILAASISRGQIADLDPGLLTQLVGGLAWVGGMMIARSADPDGTRLSLGRAMEAMLRGLAPGDSR
jgi:AcrR family transcriptional regulator